MFDIKAAHNQIARDAAKTLAAEDVQKAIKGGIKSTIESVKGFLGDIAHAGGALQKASNEVENKAIEAQQAKAKEIKRMVDDLAKAAAQAGMSENDKQLDNLKRWKHEQEEATKLIAESLKPIDKYKQTLDEIVKLHNEGLLTDKQTDSAITKAEQDQRGKHQQDQLKMEQTRRFDFRGPKQNTEKDKAAELAETAKKQLVSAEQAEWYQQQLYLFGLNDQANQDTIVDLP